jgi:hypothetical protein
MMRWAAALLLCVAACKRDSTPWVDRLKVDAFQGGEVISVSKEQLEKQLRERLSAAKFNVADEKHPVPDSVKPWRVALAAGLSEPDLETRESSLELVIELAHTGDDEPFVIDRRKQLPAPDGDVESVQNSIRDALNSTLDSSVREAGALIRLQDASSSTLHEKLNDGDTSVRGAALRLLVRAHDKAVLPVLLEQLKSTQLDELRVTVGQLVELRVPEAVNPLVETASRRGPVFEREVIFAVGAIGGDDAEAYLDLVATGADDEVLSESAAQSLSELRARKTQGEKK